jgi:hypothetical protein
MSVSEILVNGKISNQYLNSTAPVVIDSWTTPLQNGTQNIDNVFISADGYYLVNLSIDVNGATVTQGLTNGVVSAIRYDNGPISNTLVSNSEIQVPASSLGAVAGITTSNNCGLVYLTKETLVNGLSVPAQYAFRLFASGVSGGSATLTLTSY